MKCFVGRYCIRPEVKEVEVIKETRNRFYIKGAWSRFFEKKNKGKSNNFYGEIFYFSETENEAWNRFAKDFIDGREEEISYHVEVIKKYKEQIEQMKNKVGVIKEFQEK